MGGIYLKRRSLMFNQEEVGIRLEIWIDLPMRSERIVSCEMQSKNLAEEIVRKFNRCTKGYPIKMRMDGDLLVSDDEKDTIEIYDTFGFVTQYKKAKALLDRANKAYAKVPGCANKLKQRLVAAGIKLPYGDEVRINESGLSVRFIGGFSAWSGDEDICDVDILSESVCKKIQGVVRKFEKECGMKIDFYTGEKAWSYFDFNPKY